MVKSCRPGHGWWKWIVEALVIAACLAAAVTAARAEDVEDRLERLETQVARQAGTIARQEQQIARFQAEQSNSWLDEKQREQVRELIRETLADAEMRASLLDDGALAGWDNGFFLTSADGNYLLKIKGMIQTRYVYSYQDAPADPDQDDDESGFEMRGRVDFLGHIIDPSWRYMLLIYFKPDGDVKPLDMYVLKQLDERWSVTVGQFKLPFMYEYLVSQTRLQFVDRSLVSGELCGTYTQGVMATWQTEDWRVYLSFNDGESSANTAAFDDSSDYGLTGRVEWKHGGTWAQYGYFESWPGEPRMVVLGAAVLYQQGESGGAADTSDILRWTADASIKLGGANLFAAVVGNHLANGEDLDQYAAVIQGGYFITTQIELIARYEWGDSDVSGESDLSVLTAGWNYFFSGFSLRWTTDIGWAFEPVSPTWASESLDWLADAPTSDGHLVARSMVQLLF